ncbi:MAG: hypothetical protein U0797_12525 [Gemmataceae bacterium]
MIPTLTLLLASCLPSATPETEHYDPQPGDILLFRTPGLARAVVYALGCSPGVTHCGVVVARPDGSLGLLEAPGNDYPTMISDIPSRHDYHKGTCWVRRRCTPLTPEQCKCLTEFACRQEGKPFFFAGVFIPPFGKPIPKCFRRCVKPEQLEPGRWFCSPLVVAALMSAGVLDLCDAKPWFVDPQDLKADTWLDLSCGWEKPTKWLRCGEKKECWLSISCCGQHQWWK